MKLDRAVLALTAVAFTGFGAVSLVRPRILRKIGLAAVSPDGNSEIRAMYGGMELGLGIFFARAALKPNPSREVLLAQVCAIGGLAAGRLAGLLLDGPGPMIRLLLLAEAGTAGAGIVAMFTDDDQRSQEWRSGLGLGRESRAGRDPGKAV